MQKRQRAKENKPSVPITPELFRSLIVYLLSDYISRPFLTKMRVFFDSCNVNLYKEDGDLELLYRVTNRLIETYLDDKISDVNLAADKILSSPVDGEEIHDLLVDLQEEIDVMDANKGVFIENEYISRLNFIIVNPMVQEAKESLSRFENGDFSSYDAGIRNLQASVSKINKSITAKSTTSLSIPDVNFGSKDELSTAISKVRNLMNDEKRVIKTGVKRLNKMLGGGWAPGRVYVFCAISGGWKSGLLLNAAIWAAKYNPLVRCNDISKKPAVFYLTQENDVQETIERMISYVGATDENGKALSEEEIMQKFADEQLSDAKWEVVIKYRPKNSITTGDIEGLINEIEGERDVEVKMVVHDYIKRIKPDVSVGDLRIDIGEAINDFSILAKARKIPIVTANQLNREAYRVLEKTASIRKDGSKDVKMDMGMKLDQSMISESNMLLENSDWVGAIHREMSVANKQMYLAFKNLKNRSDKDGSVISNNYFVHPFEGTNGMRLQEDYSLDTSLSLDSIKDNLGMFITEDEEEGFDEDADRESAESGMVRPKKKVIHATRAGSVAQLNLDELDVD